MASEWIYRLFAVVAASDLDSARSLGSQLDPDSGGIASFARGISASGLEPATHHAICTALTEALRVQLDAAIAGGALPSLTYYRWDAETGALLGTNSGTVTGSIGRTWGVDQSLADLGLALI